MCKKSYIILVLSFLLLFSVSINAQSLQEYWPEGQKVAYKISNYGKLVGYCTTTNQGKVEHNGMEDLLLFITEIEFALLPNYRTYSELYTQASGYPIFFEAEYSEGEDFKLLEGYKDEYNFKFTEVIGGQPYETDVNMSPLTMICDRQTIPHWNLAFRNCDDFGRDSLFFNILIPNLKQRVILSMTRQDDQKITVLGEETNCMVYFCNRTDEYYYITPNRMVARVHIPSQESLYELFAIENPHKKTKPEKKQ